MSFRVILGIGIAVVVSILVGMGILFVREGGGAITAWGDDAPSVLARQAGLLNRAVDDRKDAVISLVAPPTNHDEAQMTKKALDLYLASDGPGALDWEKFRTWAAAHGKPETVAAFDQIWEKRSAAVAAYRRFVDGLASAPDGAAAGPWADARRTEQYVALHNDFEENEDALYAWVVRLAPSDFKN
ncbi:MAG TPA: hypothetical protein VIM58_11335 [Candidatus Methylacidiphilales bacterium]